MIYQNKIIQNSPGIDNHIRHCLIPGLSECLIQSEIVRECRYFPFPIFFLRWGVINMTSLTTGMEIEMWPVRSGVVGHSYGRFFVVAWLLKKVYIENKYYVIHRELVYSTICLARFWPRHNGECQFVGGSLNGLIIGDIPYPQKEEKWI